MFVGEVIAFSGQRHESLDSNSGGANTAASADGKPAPRRLAAFPISIYEVSVERVLAGALDQGSTAILEQPGGLVSMADGSQTVIMLEGDDPLEVGGRYLFFASVKPGGALTAAPFARFTVASDGSIEPTEAWAGLPAARILAGLTIDEAAREIEAVAD